MACRLCERQAADDFCRYHGDAKARVESAYSSWSEAYGSMSWADYLEAVVKNVETGEWAAEVAGMMLSEARAQNRP
ncbi:MAG: hypothetical protein LYZ69_07460 [Nitrososphaerales archaeon]|nr:hypothetical protein [Nitrososphaerales archaeon]